MLYVTKMHFSEGFGVNRLTFNKMGKLLFMFSALQLRVVEQA